MTIIDTSAWIEMLRPTGDPQVRREVVELIQSGEARLIPPVALELWNGARGEKEKRGLAQIEAALDALPVTTAVWKESYALARRARAAGLTSPAIDLLIQATARHHGARLLSTDAHIAALQALG
ncbi:PIN domain-containing protein [Actomonas aquatica]|uniref:Ribonuclease VapC n=1 Tax=Actomonas aquatica TaxID=2866162 RepID=A0ABZ1C6Q4_9BACT|nr:PIN domain-containing protein [Opitutus sp. WL0086]WRQ87092.1 PIN domain-containing protein [Opitutus sp. WL0086]